MATQKNYLNVTLLVTAILLIGSLFFENDKNDQKNVGGIAVKSIVPDSPKKEIPLSAEQKKLDSLIERIKDVTRYPGVRKGEVFFDNISTTNVEIEDGKGGFLRFDPKKAVWINLRQIDWRTKRLGDTTYNTDGTIAQGYRPVFIKESEIKERQIKWAKEHKNDPVDDEDL